MKSAFSAADILLPKEGINMTKWSVVACDQYTSQPEYWNEVEKEVGNVPSTLRLVLPEVYLSSEDVGRRIEEIQQTMRSYLDGGEFTEVSDALIYIRRKQADGRIREGLIGKLDLEQYDYRKGSISAVRATEATVVERIPPRIKVREGAPIELPHIMILLDDTQKTVIEPIGAQSADKRLLYSFPLMQCGGEIEGYSVEGDSKTKALEAIERLYGDKPNPLVFAMGDGNHSLATAKEFYERLKAANPDKDLSNHPARYALVELTNLHSEALEFEAIHRIVNGVEVEKFISDMYDELGLSEKSGEQEFSYFADGREQRVSVGKPTSNLTVGSVQNFIDRYISENGGEVDYIHGADTVRELSKKPDSVAIILPDMAKEQLFPTVIKDGALPRKTFSMGHAHDKRFYVEARKIIAD